jgi:hypothetical protein
MHRHQILLGMLLFLVLIVLGTHHAIPNTPSVSRANAASGTKAGTLTLVTGDAIRVTVTRKQGIQGGSQIIFDKQVADSKQKLYLLLTANPELMPGTPISCPNILLTSTYFHYEMTFYHDSSIIGDAVSDTIGCQTITITLADGTTHYYSWRSPTNGSYWDALHQVTGAPVPN